MKKLLILAAIAACFVGNGAFAGDLSPLKVVKVGGRSILANDKGFTVYIFDKDQAAPGKSVCNGGCASLWPAVGAPAGQLQAPLSAITRDDGSKQLALGGKPLYLFKSDKAQGDIKGDGFSGIWHIVDAPASGIIDLMESTESTESIAPLTSVTLGDGRNILANEAQLTLYTYDPDLSAPGKSVCNGGCAAAWPPALTKLDQVEAPLSIITRDDGAKQLAYDGNPVYLFVGDSATKDINGDGLDGIWHVVVLK